MMGIRQILGMLTTHVDKCQTNKLVFQTMEFQLQGKHNILGKEKLKNLINSKNKYGIKAQYQLYTE